MTKKKRQVFIAVKKKDLLEAVRRSYELLGLGK